MKKEIVQHLLSLIENPNIKKQYNDIKKYYEQKDMKEEAEAFKELIEKKFTTKGV